MEISFPQSYEESRARFLLDVERIRRQWPASHLVTHPLQNHPALSIDGLWAEPRKKETLILLSTGEHGIEGFVGSALLQLFMNEFAPWMDQETTGLLLVHAINPWGMKHFRKVNENNVDLNRNFVYGSFDKEINPGFKSLETLLSPSGAIRSLFRENFLFWGRLLRALLTHGISGVSTAALLGQYHTPKGFFFGGSQYEESTRVLSGLYEQALKEYDQVIQVDLHTGYGPRHQMSILIPPLDPISSREASEKFNFPLVQKINPEEFYAIQGDMGEYVYRLRDDKFPHKKIFICGFEFGTFGESLLARIRSLRAMVLENQLHWNGAVSKASQQTVQKEFIELYFPSSRTWRTKAIADGRQAYQGIFSAFGLLNEPPAINSVPKRGA